MWLFNRGDLMGRFDLIEVTSWAGLTVPYLITVRYDINKPLCFVITSVYDWYWLTGVCCDTEDKNLLYSFNLCDIIVYTMKHV